MRLELRILRIRRRFGDVPGIKDQGIGLPSGRRVPVNLRISQHNPQSFCVLVYRNCEGTYNHGRKRKACECFEIVKAWILNCSISRQFSHCSLRDGNTRT